MSRTWKIALGVAAGVALVGGVAYYFFGVAVPGLPNPAQVKPQARPPPANQPAQPNNGLGAVLDGGGSLANGLSNLVGSIGDALSGGDDTASVPDGGPLSDY